MRFQVADENEIRWMYNPSGYAVADVVQKIKDAGRWNNLLALEQDEDGVVDCDALYDRLQHESQDVLRSVGLHENEAEVTALDVVKAWATANADDGLRISYADDGKTPSGLALYDYGRCLGICLEFESVDADGSVEEVSLDKDEVFYLVKHLAPGATDYGWAGTDPNTDKFEMWVGEE